MIRQVVDITDLEFKSAAYDPLCEIAVVTRPLVPGAMIHITIRRECPSGDILSTEVRFQRDDGTEFSHDGLVEVVLVRYIERTVPHFIFFKTTEYAFQVWKNGWAWEDENWAERWE